MTEQEFRQTAIEAGYTEEEITDLIEFHNENGVPFDQMPLIVKIVD